MVNDSSHSLEPPRCLPTLSTLRTPGRLKGQPGRSSYYFPREDGSLSIRLIARVERLIARGIWLAGEMFISIRLLMLPTLFFALKRTGPGSHMRNPLRPNSGVGVFIQNQAARLVIPGTPLSSPDWSGLDFRGCLWISPACWPRPSPESRGGLWRNGCSPSRSGMSCPWWRWPADHPPPPDGSLPSPPVEVAERGMPGA
jgi:hypothetical protein